jgi:hypothetical protein
MSEPITQLVRTKMLVKAIDDSVDAWDYNENRPFVDFLADKFKETVPSFRSSIVRNGIKVPIEVGISRHRKKKLYMGNGHHRLAVAYFKNVPEIPVAFVKVKDLDSFSWDCASPGTWDDRYIDSEGRKLAG